ncbi:hypothetical protein CCY99_00070 [Helicobacter sp. 16-1353]|nr:hypothetical protein CCY99_00070 [Helicobacter sp. 16-1353]
MIKIRMCICCRKRHQQKSLLRLQVINGKLCEWTRNGRSFYVCNSCIVNKNYAHIICKIHKINSDDSLIKFLKETIFRWQKNNYQK